MLTAILFWVMVGLVAGFLASLVMRGGGYGVVGDIIVGIVGALIGGFLMSLFSFDSAGIIIYSTIVAFIGACILIAILRVVSRGTTRRGTYDSPTYSKNKNNTVPPARNITQPPLSQESSYVPPPVQQARPRYVSPPVVQPTPRYAPPTLSLFISHSSRDDEFGLKLVHDLRRELGGDEAVWYDSEGGLYGGESWWRRIVSVLEKCDVFVIIISSNSMNSKWVMRELDIATSENKRIIPILYRQCDIPADLRAIQQISFLDTVPYNVAFDRLMQALKH